jgi:PAS domain S-box-containing protein
MIKPTILANEAERLEELLRLKLLDTDDEEAFDQIVKLASYITKCPVTLVSLIDSERQWFKAKHGTTVTETPRDISFCGHAIHYDEMFIVEDAHKDERFQDNPLVVNDPNIQFYAGQPLITKNGFRIGTLCALDHIPRSLDDEQKSLLKALAQQVTALIEKRARDSEVRMSQRNLDLLFAKTEVILAFMKGPEHRFEYVNPAHVRLLNGVNATGKTVREVQPEAVEGGIIEMLDDSYLRGKTLDLKNLPTRVGTEIRFFDFTFTPSYGESGKIDGVMAIVNDITAQKDLEHRLSLAIDISGVGFYDWDIKSDVVTYSDHMKRSWGLEASTTLQEAINFIHPEDQEKTSRLIAEAIENKSEYRTEFRVRRPDGRIIWIDARGTITYDEQGLPDKFLGTSVDITDRKHTELEIASSLEQLKEERDLREQFVAALTHDLRTPLTAAKMSAQLLDRKADSSVHRLTARIVANMDRADAMIRDLLDVSKIKVGESMHLELKECSLTQIAHATVEDFITVHGDRIRLEAYGEVKGFWDEDMLRRILENLTNNAIKYGAANSAITIRVNQEKRMAELSVHNTGNPIPEKDRMTLFEPYKRSENIGSQKGWGIGLTLVRGFAQAMNGTVKVDSSEQSGTTFSIFLPTQG